KAALLTFALHGRRATMSGPRDAVAGAARHPAGRDGWTECDDDLKCSADRIRGPARSAEGLQPWVYCGSPATQSIRHIQRSNVMAEGQQSTDATAGQQDAMLRLEKGGVGKNPPVTHVEFRGGAGKNPPLSAQALAAAQALLAAQAASAQTAPTQGTPAQGTSTQKQ